MKDNQCGSHLSENVRLTLPASVPIVSAGISLKELGVFLEAEEVVKVERGLFLRRESRSFLGARVSHSGVWCISVAIVRRCR